MSAGRLFVEVTGAAGRRGMRRAVVTATQKMLNFKMSLQSLKPFNVSGVTKDTKGAAGCVGSDTNKLSQGDDVTNKESRVAFWLQICPYINPCTPAADRESALVPPFHGPRQKACRVTQIQRDSGDVQAAPTPQICYCSFQTSENTPLACLSPPPHV